MKTIYTFYADAAKIALASIFAHKLRAFLTLIGIIIGVASVVVVGAAISRAEHLRHREGVEDAGVEPLHDRAHGQLRRVVRRRIGETAVRRNPKLQFADMEWLARALRSRATPSARRWAGADLRAGRRALLRRHRLRRDGEHGRDRRQDDGGRSLPPTRRGRERAARRRSRRGHQGQVLSRQRPDQPDSQGAGACPCASSASKSGAALSSATSWTNTSTSPSRPSGASTVARSDMQIHGKSATREAFQLTIEDARTALRNYHKLIGSEEDDFGLVNTEEFERTDRPVHRRHRAGRDAHHADLARRRRHRGDEHHARVASRSAPSRSVCARRSARGASRSDAVPDRVGDCCARSAACSACCSPPPSSRSSRRRRPFR